MASLVAGYLTEIGRRPAILTRDYGGDESRVHAELDPEVLVVRGADRFAGAVEARQRGADVVVMDDGFQRADIEPELAVALVAAEHLSGPLWLLPAGRWRETLGGLRRANRVVVTRRTATDAEVEFAETEIRCHFDGDPGVVRCGISHFTPLAGGDRIDPEGLNGARVLACAGVAEPGRFFVQLERLGIDVRPMPLRDHHPYSIGTVATLAQRARDRDFVIVTMKDAVKLRDRWTATRPRMLVANQSVLWERGARDFFAAVREATGKWGDPV
jgi:tetraacyldisaccharide 4'-kinase